MLRLGCKTVQNNSSRSDTCVHVTINQVHPITLLACMRTTLFNLQQASAPCKRISRPAESCMGMGLV
jgi:hypothetical protein